MAQGNQASPKNRTQRSRDTGTEIKAYIVGTVGLVPTPAAEFTRPSMVFGDDETGVVGGDYEFADIIGTVTGDQIVPVKVDASEGTDTTWGSLVGPIDNSNVVFFTSHGSYIPGTMQVWLNGIELIKDDGFGETSPNLGKITLTTAPDDTANEWLVLRYLTLNIPYIVVQGLSDSTGTVAAISGDRDEANTLYTLPLPYISGSALVFKNGRLLLQGSAEEFVETDPDLGTVTVADAPFATDFIESSTLVGLGNHYLEDTDGTLDGDIDDLNRTFTTSYKFKYGTLEVRWNGVLLAIGEDYTEIARNKFKMVGIPTPGDVVGTFFEFGNQAVVDPALSGGLVSTATNYTTSATDLVIAGDATSGTITITLTSPDIGHIYYNKKIDASANGVILSPESGTIDGDATYTILTRYEDIPLAWDGTDYHVL